MKNTLLTLLLLALPFLSVAIIAPITGPSAVCPGTTISLTDATPGGVWSTSNTAIATISSSGIVTGIATGGVTITYTVSGSYVTTTVTVEAAPAAYSVMGGGSFCAGGAGVIISLPGSDPGIDYQLWFGGSPVGAAITGIGTPITFGLITTAGTYTVIADMAMTGCSRVMTGSATVAVNPVPSPISGPTTVCDGSPAGFSEIVPGGTWTSTTPAIAVIDPSTGLLTGVSPGLATIRYILASGCYTSTTVTVNAGPGPIYMPSSLCAGSSFSATAPAPGGVWSSVSSAITVGSISGVVTGVGAGTALLTYSLGMGCNSTRSITINAIPAAITGVSSLCAGGSATLSDPTPGGTWMSSAPSVSQIGSSTGLLIGNSTGAAIITYAFPSGCSSLHTINVTPGICSGTPTPGTTVASATTPCPNDIVSVSIPGTSPGCGVTCQWQSSPDGITFMDIAGATSASYSYPAAGTKYFRCKETCATTGLFSYSAAASVTTKSRIQSHIVYPAPDSVCGNTDFYIAACGASPSFTVITFFGDGANSTSALTSSGICHTDVLHTYNLPGTYTVKHVLYDGGVPQDSVSFSYEYQFCRTLPIKFYIDVNADCSFDAGDRPMPLSVVTEVDSNGVVIDSISSTAGFYYKAVAPAGTVYAFRVRSIVGGLHTTCPATGVIYDTIQPSVSVYPPKYMGLTCTSGTSLADFEEHVATSTGRHMQTGTIMVDNIDCLSENAAIILHISPKYRFGDAYPSPTSITGNTVTWNVSSLTTTTSATLTYTVNVPTPAIYSSWLVPGDTVQSNYVTVNTTTGTDTTNNFIKIDTVKSSFDPNEISVSPSGYVLPCTKLQYTIRFENTGNDTAHNIYIMDTLSDNLDGHSLKVEAATSQMNISILNDGTHLIAKFDFPAINLPDTALHALSDGFVVFNISTKNGLADGTTIFNHAGIFFDDNPPVLTNTVENVIGISAIYGKDTLCAGTQDTLSNNTTGGAWSMSNSRASVTAGIVSGISAGADTVTYTVSNTCATKATTKYLTIMPLPVPGPITGPTAVCEGGSIALVDTPAGGNWSSSSTPVASVSSVGVVTGSSTGVVTITYSSTNSCGTTAATRYVTVNPLPATITGIHAVCVGATATLTDSSAGGTWTSGSSSIASVGSSSGIVSGIAAGSTALTYTLPTGCLRTGMATINALPTAYHLSGGSYCAGDTGVHIILSDSDPSTSYFLYLGSYATGTVPGSGSALDMGLQTLAGRYTVVATNTLTSCHGGMADTAVVSVTPSVVPSLTLTAAPGINICPGTSVSFSTLPVNEGASPSYLWMINGTTVASGSSYSFLPANGDHITVLLTSNALCARPDTASQSLTIHVLDIPNPTESISVLPGTLVNPGDMITLTAHVSGSPDSTTYQWVLNHTVIPGATDSTYSNNIFMNADSVSCEITSANICGSVKQSRSTIITLSNVGIRQLRNSYPLVVAPNPTHDYFSVQYTSANGEDAVFQLTDITGRVLTTVAMPASAQHITVSVRDYAAGIYLYRVLQHEHFVTGGKVVKD